MKHRKNKNLCGIALVIFFTAGMGSLSPGLNGQLRTTGTLSAGMVAQRQQEIPLWGEANPGALVHAEMNGVSASSDADGAGKWVIRLPAMEAGGPFLLKIWAGNDTLRLENIYVGDVWLASGQSNMAMRLEETDNAGAEIAKSENPLIRQYLVRPALGNEPSDQPPAGSQWMKADPENSGIFSAVGYYFARYLHENLDIPIGIINSSYGGTRIESWMSKEILGYDEQDISFGEENFYQPTVAYNTMLHPLIRTPVKGIIWYQGESNMGSRETAVMYTGQLEKLISSWRALWGLGDLPFIWVQIPNAGSEANESSPGTWDALPILRAAQSRALALPNTGEITAIDLGEVDIHPKEKEPVGLRLSLVARKLVYGDSIESSGPGYLGHREIGGGRIELSFDHVGDGLVAKETGDQSLRWFALAGSDGSFYRANAVIVGDKVEVWNDGIPDPAIIRYAWEHNPFNTNFYNSEDLPARPFKVRLKHPGFSLQSFKAVDYFLEKGESTQLTWEWSGAENLLLNGIPVDSVGGWRIWPGKDSVFTLSAGDREDPGNSDSVSLTIRVQQPDPTIDIFADRGEWLTPGSEVRLWSRVSAPLGGSVSLVEFYANDEKIASVSDPPFECKWMAASAGTYHLYGVVSNHLGMTGRSDSIMKVVDHFESLRFEAEEAEIRGGKRMVENDSVSGGAYVELTRDWTITFPGFHLDSAQVCQLSFYSLLNFGSPKVQSLFLDGLSHSDLIFEAPGDELWVDKDLLMHLDSASHSISLKSNWGYISLDYLELLYRPSRSGLDSTTGTRLRAFEPGVLLYPNPCVASTRITFSLPEGGDAQIELYDVSGRKIAVLLSRKMEAGTHHLDFHPGGLENGTYILHMRFEAHLIRKKLIIHAF